MRLCLESILRAFQVDSNTVSFVRRFELNTLLRLMPDGRPRLPPMEAGLAKIELSCIMSKRCKEPANEMSREGRRMRRVVSGMKRKRRRRRPKRQK